MIPQALACIHTDALRHNLEQVKVFAPDAKVLAVVKADAYGHNLDIIAGTLLEADAYAVGTIEEAEQLSAINISLPIVILQGIEDKQSLSRCLEQDFQIVLHSEYQVALLEAIQTDKTICVWLKMDTRQHLNNWKML